MITLRMEMGPLRNLVCAMRALRTARVLLKQIGPERCVGNLGLDLLKQTDWFKMDFDAMTLELHGKP